MKQNTFNKSKKPMVDESIEVNLSLESSYTGSYKKLEITPVENGYSYLQVVEGCGYTVFSITEQELIELSEKLNKFLNK